MINGSDTTNAATVWLSFGGLALAATYPFMKRYTYYPQMELAREINQVDLYKALGGGWGQSVKMANR